ncbi:MAG: c-type cytochrome domain-containing protein [Pirellulales bacterium]
MYRSRRTAVALAWTLSTSVSSADEPVDFGKQILPLLKKNCVACHHKKEAESGVNLETHSALMKGGDEGVIIVRVSLKKVS